MDIKLGISMAHSIEKTGPAIEYPNGYKSWWLNDICYGGNNDFTNISWSKFVKTLIFS